MDAARQLRVVGEGGVTASPDRWILVAAINAMAESAAEALTKVNQLVTSAKSALDAIGIEASSLRTQNLLLPRLLRSESAAGHCSGGEL